MGSPPALAPEPDKQPRRRLPPAGFANSWPLLRQPAFATYFAGSVTSNLGTWLQTTAQTLLAYQLTHSVFAVGLITAAQFGGFLLLGPFSSSLTVRLNQKAVLVVTQVASAGVSAVLAVLQFSGRLTARDLLVAALITGLASTFALPVQNAMVPALVGPDDTKAALAMNSVSYNVGRTLAPVLYLVVLESIGVAWAFALNAGTFLVFAGIVVIVHPPHRSERTADAGFWSSARLAVDKPRILLLLAMAAAVTFAEDPIQVLGPPLAHLPRISPISPAYFLAALGLGTMIGALLLPRSSESRLAAWPLLVLACSVVLFAVGVSRWLSLGAAVMAGAAGLLTNSAAQAKLDQTAGPPNRTQAMALWLVAWAGVKPIASLIDGWLASRVDLRLAAFVLVIPALAVALLELFLRPKRRDRMKDYMRAKARKRTGDRRAHSAHVAEH
jgi:MFS family permease